MVNQNQDDMCDPMNSLLVDVNPNQDDFGQVNRKHVSSVTEIGYFISECIQDS